MRVRPALLLTTPVRPQQSNFAGGTSGTERTPEPDDAAGVQRAGTIALNEDWAATIIGLVLLALVLLGAIPGWLVP